MKRERSESPFQMSSPLHPLGAYESLEYQTVTLSAVCKENKSCFDRQFSPTHAGPFTWHQGSPELAPSEFSWSRPDFSRMASPLSSHADCSLTEDGSNTLSPHLPTIFEPTDYTNTSSFPGTPQDQWLPYHDIDYQGHDCNAIQFGAGVPMTMFNMTCYPKPHDEMKLSLPVYDSSIFDEQGVGSHETSSRSCKRKSTTTQVKQEVLESDYLEDEASDYAPRPKKKSKATKSAKGKTNKTRSTNPTSKTSNLRLDREAELDRYITMNATEGGSIPCPHCPQQLNTKAVLTQHISSSHGRTFACTFHMYGCKSTFGSKNEWKRHVASKHLTTAYWRCNRGRCFPSKADDQFKDFNRKDLFMQHVRRMHMPVHAASKDELNTSIDDIVRECYTHVRDPPQASICGFCFAEGRNEIFRGPGSWDHRMEHVGKHLEQPGWGQQDCVIDQELEDWLLDEGLIVDDGRGRLVLRNIVEDGKRKD